MIRTTIGVALAALMCCAFLDGQIADRRPAFEVASVKPAPPFVNGADYRMRGGPGTDDPGQITYPRTWLGTLLTMAYGVRLDQISGPAWINTEAYSIVAKIPPNTTKDQFNLMLQNLLAERFHLTLHHETKDFTVYSLLVAKGGPKMMPFSPDMDAKTTPPASAPMDRKGFPVLAPGARFAIAPGVGELYGTARSTHRQTMAEFVEQLGAIVNMSNGDGVVRGGPPAAHVIDKTGLTGEFEFTLEFAGSVMPGGANDALAPNLSVALEKQLGLKLEKGKAGLDVLVIDHVDKVPTEN
jgi:uncharacterized protein (TIGR03435 family)